MAEALRSVTYSSTAASDFGERELDELLASSRAANLSRDLSGMLLFRGNRFLQVLEGPESLVRELIDRIRRDPRHRDMRVLVDEEIEQRRFADWTMGYESLKMPQNAAPEGFRDSFDDLDSDDGTITARALRELTLWFRTRSADPR
ncbi:hypothetical protein NS220_03295 [Microbacterium testaceum]|uniref:BLUF domain-containing protein n=1 Tax=Microbacterium testaceum TaxID=2033 RepID=A0A147F0F1_MICTE|nr:BLUF domain-containing protein [Microbacterium testaceum]KTR96114.1 hypothetical protein NS220_03295 [Microbacterium testaceum]